MHGYRVGIFLLERCGDALTRQGQCSRDAWFKVGVFRFESYGKELGLN